MMEILKMINEQLPPTVMGTTCNFFPANVGTGQIGVDQTPNLFRFHEVLRNIVQPPPIIVPTIEFSEFAFLEYLRRNKNSSQSFQDILRIDFEMKHKAELSREVILKKFIQTGKKSGCIFCDALCYYQLEDGFNGQNHLPKNFWTTSDYAAQGIGLFSCIKYATRLPDIDVFLLIADVIGVDISGVAIPQLQGGEETVFIDNPDLHRNLVPVQFPITFLGNPHTVYPFTNDYGQIGFYLCRWEYLGEVVQLCLTLNHNEKENRTTWEYLAPPYKQLIFNRYLIERYKNYAVHIHNDIANVKPGICNGIIETWSGDLSIADSLPWDCLEGINAKVRYAFNESNDESVAIGALLREKLGTMGIPLEWVALNNYQTKGI